jgi:predicted ArsR family transcriptional regulator
MVSAMPRRALHLIPSTDHWAVLMAPVRFEIIEVMRSIAPCSVGEIARALDRAADTLYPHLRQLVRIGVVVDAGERPGRTRSERLYDLVADDFRPAFGGKRGPATVRAIDRSVQTMTGIVSRASAKAAAAGRLTFTSEFQNVLAKVESAWLTDAEVAQVRDRLRALKRYLDARKARRDGSLYLTAFFVLPVVRARGARASASSKATRASTRATRSSRPRQSSPSTSGSAS